MSTCENFRIGVDETFRIGEDAYYTSLSEGHGFGVAFEDDTATGYFYAFLTEGDGIILDALHIYNVEDVLLKANACRLQVLWKANGLVASLLINDYCHAIFDFGQQRGCCRNGFPENVGVWKQEQTRMLTDEMLPSFFE